MAYLGWRRRAVQLQDDSARMQEAALWLAVMNLGSFRSPFVPDAYGLNVWMVWRSLPSPRLRLRPVPHGVAPAEA